MFPFLKHFRSYSSSTGSLKKLLIANRGEIACRIIQTAKKLGVKTVSLYSDADKFALHVIDSGEAYHIGKSPSQESYLNAQKIIAIAKRSGAQAIHPGYGFLSENAEFAELCQENGITFIGPPASAIRSMGIKSTSKSIMSSAGVPVITGYHGEDQSDGKLKDEAIKLGFPVMIKAVKGGGGKGMRICMTEKDFDDQLGSARREAIKSFGDGSVLIEKFVHNPRHVEVQVFGDMHGNYVYMFERDCSVQRRHQKIIEEAPAPGISDSVRQSLGEAAVKAARAVNYVGAGTVEFIMDEKHDFYFMEMNTRLQVEHPVTEMITGLDLVDWQLKVAFGEKLPLTQSAIKFNGHSFEARIYAEDPNQNFMPGSGPLTYMETPNSASDVRIETGVRQGDEISVHYDPMIAKLVVWAQDRSSALNKLHRKLSEYNIYGINTNVNFLKDLASHSEFHLGNVHTDFIPQHETELFPIRKLPTRLICATVLNIILENRKIDQIADPFSVLNGLAANNFYQTTFTFNHKDTTYKIQVVYESNGHYKMHVDGKAHDVTGMKKGSSTVTAMVDDVTFTTEIVNIDNKILVHDRDHSYELSLPYPDFLNTSSTASAQKGVIAPMPGIIEKLTVKVGDQVNKGDSLIVMIAMKMEYIIKAHSSGIVEEVFCQAGQNVSKNTTLIRIKENE